MVAATVMEKRNQRKVRSVSFMVPLSLPLSPCVAVVLLLWFVVGMLWTVDTLLLGLLLDQARSWIRRHSSLDS